MGKGTWAENLRKGCVLTSLKIYVQMFKENINDKQGQRSHKILTEKLTQERMNIPYVVEKFCSNI